MNAIEEQFAQIQSDLPCSPSMTHFHVYENLNFISELKFEKDRITIGRNKKADLFLDHQAVADIHAFVNFKGQQPFLTNRFPQNGLRLNGMPVHTAPLKNEDVIVIGPFALKVQVKDVPAVTLDGGQTTYALRLVNRYGSPEMMQTAAEHLAKMLRTDLQKIKPLLAKKHVVVKRGLRGLEAAQIQNSLLKAGIICDVQVEDRDAANQMTDESNPDLIETTPSDPPRQSFHPSAPTSEAALEEIPEPSSLTNAVVADSGPIVASEDEPVFFPMDEETDENGDIWDAPFSLNQILAPAGPSKNPDKTETHLQVIKTMGNSVVDAAPLTTGQTYRIESAGRRLDLIRNTGGQAMITFSDTLDGVILNSAGSVTADLNDYKRQDYRSPNDRSRYEIPFPETGAVVIDDGACQYRIDRVHYAVSPDIANEPAAKMLLWKHWAFSLGLHGLLFLTIALSAFFKAPPVEKQPLHFVKIDQSALQQMEKPKKKPQPKKPVPPQPPVQKAKPTVKPPAAQQTKQPVKKAAKPTKNTNKKKKVSGGARASKHPKAGGGFGNGNIKNRNINQTGLLGVLGGASTSGPSQALVAVTNIDAVSVPGATEKNFSVGGLKGSLGNGQISVATGQIVQTKGSSQVLRSGGASGKGDVAALERGTTGKKKVQAMVTAKMNRTVKIEGGMSREMVKRVIDQHLDEITYCYETALMSNPSILGRIVFEWKILKDGRVGEIRIVASSVNSNTIHGCIKSAIKSWRFPKPVGTEVIVSYPFVFDLVSF